MTRLQQLRDEAWLVLNEPSSPRYRAFHAAINTLIVVSVGIVVWEVVGPPSPSLHTTFAAIDRAILYVFLVEFLARLAVIRDWVPRSVRLSPTQKIKYFVYSRLRFLLSPWGLIDFFAILPLFPFLRSLRILRLLRLFRSVQFFRYASPLRTLSMAFRDNSLLFAVAMSFVVGSIVLSALMFFLAEKNVNPNVQSLTDTLWWAIVTVSTVGFGDITPVTGGGKVVGALLMLAGMFIIAMFAGVISSTLVGHLLPLRMEQVRMSSIADHIIIAGWNSEVPMILSEMQRESGERMPPVLVFAMCERPDDLDERFVFVHGDCRREAEYEKVRFNFAASVVVVADEGTHGDQPAVRDASTVLTVFTIRSLERKLKVQRSEPIHIVAEILDPENHNHAVVAGANEVIETSRVGSSLLAHTAGNPGVAKVLTSLMLASPNNIYTSRLPPQFVDDTSLLGDVDRITERMRRYAQSGITTLTVAPWGKDAAARMEALEVAVEAHGRLVADGSIVAPVDAPS